MLLLCSTHTAAASVLQCLPATQRLAAHLHLLQWHRLATPRDNAITCALTALQQRGLATPRGSAGSSGIRAHLLQAIKFTVTQKEAEQAYEKYHHSNSLLLANAPGRWDKVAETWLPFWLHSVVVEARASRAQVGRRQAVQKRVGNRYETVWETSWSWASIPFQHTARFEPELAEMQVCATNRYLEGDTSAMRPGHMVRECAALGLVQPITAPGVLSPTSRVVPFSVRPADARAQVLEWIRQQEVHLAESYYKQATGCDEVRFMDLELRVLEQASIPMYVPVWVFRRALPPSVLEQLLAAGLSGTQAQATKLYTLVSGLVPGVASGSQVYNPAVAAAAAAVVGPAVLLATGLAALMSGPALLIVGIVIPALGGAAAARHMPQLRQAASDAQRSSKQAAPLLLRGVLGERLSQLLGVGSQSKAQKEQEEEDARAGRHGMEDAWVRAYMESREERERASSSRSQHREEQQQRQREQQWQWQHGRQQQQQWRQQWDSGGPRASNYKSARDPMGYYDALGVEPGVSPQELQEAFRSKALQNHPDKFPADQKAVATEKFKLISEAYTVLRNPSKRAAYDSGGRV